MRTSMFLRAILNVELIREVGLASIWHWLSLCWKLIGGDVVLPAWHIGAAMGRYRGLPVTDKCEQKHSSLWFSMHSVWQGWPTAQIV